MLKTSSQSVPSDKSSPANDQSWSLTQNLESLTFDEEIDVPDVELPPPMKIQDHNFGERLDNCMTVQLESKYTLNCDKLNCENDDEKDEEKIKQKALMKRKCALQELIETEKDYVHYLGFIVDGYIQVIRNEEVPVPEDLKNGKDRIIFGNIEAIYEWHKK